MKYSEKKKVNEFFNKIINRIEEDMHSFNHVARITNNAKIDIVEFLDKEFNE